MQGVSKQLLKLLNTSNRHLIKLLTETMITIRIILNRHAPRGEGERSVRPFSKIGKRALILRKKWLD